MIYAILVCSNPECETPYEGWGVPGDLEGLDCKECAGRLEIVAFSNAERDGVVPGSVELQPRRAA